MFNFKLYRFNFSTKKWTLLKTTGEIPQDTVASHSGRFIFYFGFKSCFTIIHSITHTVL